MRMISSILFILGVLLVVFNLLVAVYSCSEVIDVFPFMQLMLMQRLGLAPRWTVVLVWLGPAFIIGANLIFLASLLGTLLGKK